MTTDLLVDANAVTSMNAIGRSLAAASEELVDRQLAVLASHPSYAELKELDLRGSAMRNVRRTIATVSPPDAREAGEAADIISTVLHVVPGLSAQDVVSAYRAAMGVIRDAFIEQSERTGLHPDCVVAGLRGI